MLCLGDLSHSASLLFFGDLVHSLLTLLSVRLVYSSTLLFSWSSVSSHHLMFLRKMARSPSLMLSLVVCLFRKKPRFVLSINSLVPKQMVLDRVSMNSCICGSPTSVVHHAETFPGEVHIGKQDVMSGAFEPVFGYPFVMEVDDEGSAVPKMEFDLMEFRSADEAHLEVSTPRSA